jgi:hypothetical protein
MCQPFLIRFVGFIAIIKKIAILTGLLFVVSAAGCNEATILTVPVSGIVTLDGEPVEGASIFFAPSNGPAAKAETDAQGKFRLMTNRPGDGAIPGDFKVTVAKFVLDAKTAHNPVPGMKNELPEKYNTPSLSGLTATVEVKKTNSFTFELTAK